MFDLDCDLLGVAADRSPPPHQLLGISPDERDTEVIEEAALRRAGLVRRYQLRYPEESTRLLNEIGRALVAVLEPLKGQEGAAHIDRTGKEELPRPRPTAPCHSGRIVGPASGERNSHPARRHSAGAVRARATVLAPGGEGTTPCTLWRFQVLPLSAERAHRQWLASLPNNRAGARGDTPAQVLLLSKGPPAGSEFMLARRACRAFLAAVQRQFAEGWPGGPAPGTITFQVRIDRGAWGPSNRPVPNCPSPFQLTGTNEPRCFI